MNCDESQRVQSWFDGETDVTESASVQQHVAGCAACQELLADLELSRATLRSASAIRAPAALRARIAAALDAEEATSPAPAPLLAPVTTLPRAPAVKPARTWRRPFWLGALSGLGASAVAAAAAFFLLLPAASTPLVDGLLAAHVRSLGSDRLISVISTDQHTVKPWFAGRADVAPTVKDFAGQGFTLEGGRVDELLANRAAVMVYRHGKHVVNVFAWPAASAVLPRQTTRNGYRMDFWRQGDIAYCAVSDMSWTELATLEDLVREEAEAEQRLAPQ